MQHPSLLPLPYWPGAERDSAPTPCDADGHMDRALGKRTPFLNISWLSISSFRLHNRIFEPVAARTVAAAVAGAIPKRNRALLGSASSQRRALSPLFPPQCYTSSILLGGRCASSSVLEVEEEGAGGVSRVASLIALPL